MSEISVTVVGSTTINPTVGNGDTVNVTITPTGERGPTGSPGAPGPANTLTIGTVNQGAAAATITGTSPNQVLNLVLQKGDAGTPATNIELQATATHLQWRLVGASTWTDLVALSAITGPTGSTGAAGAAVELQASGTHIQWRYVGGSTWTNVVALSSLVGATGATGATGPQGPAGPPINLGDETPQPLGLASAGTALAAARADHVHAVGSITYSSLSGIPSTFPPSAHSHAVSDVTGLQTALDGKQPAGSYATLVGGTVPSSQLPSYIDDVIEYSALGAFPATNDGGKIFVARDTGKIYRWSGSAYVEISPSPGSTDSVTEGSVNLYHTTARAAAAAPVQSVAGRTGAVTLAKADVGLGSVDNTADASKPVSTAQAAADTAVQSFAIQRSNHTGTQLAATISDFATESAKYGPVVSVAGLTGTVTLAQLASSGTASSTTFLRGDGTWSAAGSTDAGDLVTGTLSAARLPLATTTVAGAVIVGSGLKIASGVISVDTPLSAPASVYYSDGLRWTPVVNAATYELSYTTDSGSSYTHAGTVVAVAGDPQAVAIANLGGARKFRVRAFSSGGVAGEWGYESGLTPPSSGSYTLPTASSGVLGGIKVGSGLAIASGVLSTTGGGGSANIVEAATAAGFPGTGSAATLYHATDVRKIFFWDSTGGVYVEAGPSGGGSGGDGTDSVLRALFVPPAPTSVTATAGNAQATVSWTAPTGVIAQAPVTDYAVQFSSNSGSTWTTFADGTSTATSATVTGLTNGTAYVFRVAAVNGVGTGAYSSAMSSVTPNAGTLVEYLIVGGGGSGAKGTPGVCYGGGGGGGGVQSGSTTISGTANIVVGSGGVGSSTVSTSANGQNSTAFGITAGGGGGGGANTPRAGSGGDSGSPQSITNAATSANPSYGGSGAGGVGTVPNGGTGVSSSITGSAVLYGGGGGGGGDSVTGSGSGGGGNGATPGVSPQSGTANTGGGGGGMRGDDGFAAGSGGSGVVIVRSATAAVATTGSPTITTVGSDTVYTFTQSGSITY
jgi:hypothetical protein